MKVNKKIFWISRCLLSLGVCALSEHPLIGSAEELRSPSPGVSTNVLSSEPSSRSGRATDEKRKIVSAVPTAKRGNKVNLGDFEKLGWAVGKWPRPAFDGKFGECLQDGAAVVTAKRPPDQVRVG